MKSIIALLFFLFFIFVLKTQFYLVYFCFGRRIKLVKTFCGRYKVKLTRKEREKYISRRRYSIPTNLNKFMENIKFNVKGNDGLRQLKNIKKLIKLKMTYEEVVNYWCNMVQMLSGVPTPKPIYFNLYLILITELQPFSW